MLDRAQLLSTLQAHVQAFQRFDQKRNQGSVRLREALADLEARGFDTLEAAVSIVESPGALPTAELKDGLVKAFPEAFSHHPEALAWAERQLEGLTTFAADGSQIEPDNRYDLPVALIQVGSYENRHSPLGDYRKETQLQVLTPEALGAEGSVKRQVDLARFEGEGKALLRFMRGRAPDSRAVVFLDGSLIVSFAEAQRSDPLAQRYVTAMRALLEASEATRTPLVAYVDASRARDLARMIGLATGEEASGVTDARLLDGRLGWGDRTAAFLCAREGILDAYGPYQRAIAFCYLQTRDQHPPARLEFPAWMLESLEPVVNAVRAEVIVGNGYPYTLAAADATAVLTTRDRERFQRTLEDFLAKLDIPLQFSTKALSKERRR